MLDTFYYFAFVHQIQGNNDEFFQRSQCVSLEWAISHRTIFIWSHIRILSKPKLLLLCDSCTIMYCALYNQSVVIALFYYHPVSAAQYTAWLCIVTVYGKTFEGKTFMLRVEIGYSLEIFCGSMLVALYCQWTRP